ncbi:hypothetical protein GC170_08015 [bacterium]|nr:hypothetical protein [bacterium]
MTISSIRFRWLLLIAFAPALVRAGDVTGIANMPPYCSPETSPAVVWLEPESPLTAKTVVKGKPMPSGETLLVRQAALQFVPRIIVAQKGQKLRFTNEDSEFHNVHVQARGELFNQTMPPGQPADFTPESTGILRVNCDIHQHMRAFVIIQETPWIMTCSRKGAYRFTDVPAGRYRITFWHEMGSRPTVHSIEVPEAGLTLEPILLKDATAPPSRSSLLTAAPAKSWQDVIDRISIRMASALEAAKRPDTVDRARKLADEALRNEFSSTDLGNAIRTHLGPDRCDEIENKFARFASEIRQATESGKKDFSAASATMRSLLANLVQATEDLKTKGVADRSSSVSPIERNSGRTEPSGTGTSQSRK